MFPNASLLNCSPADCSEPQNLTKGKHMTCYRQIEHPPQRSADIDEVMKGLDFGGATTAPHLRKAKDEELVGCQTSLFYLPLQKI